ncbi:MAG: DUF423 domain-containing protein [Planctomycetaceae bacterium]|nr:DUF423 domain-containing protein [Planctomycetaceae bacterium]
MAGLAVVLGAFAAHGLDRYCVEKYPATERATVAGLDVPMSWKRIQDFKTGAEYQMYHALGLIAVGLLGPSGRSRARNFAGVMFLSGIVLFSGSLYGITLTGVKALGAIAPIGGTAFIVGWLALAVAVCCTGGACAVKPQATV